MVKRLFWLLPILLLGLFSCSDYTAPERFEGDAYALAALLVAGQPINLEHPVYITRSASIEDFNALDIFVLDADVIITDVTTTESWSLIAVPDLAEMKIKYIDPAEHIIQPLHTYAIEVSIPGREQKITAQTTVPLAAGIIPDFYANGNGFSLTEEDMRDMPYDTIDADYPLTLNTGTYSGAFNFLAEMYCLEEFSTALEFTTPVFGIENPDTTMVDTYYNPGESIRRIRFMGRYSSAAQEGLPDNYLLVKDYRQAFVFYGRYRVSLNIVDDNYYRYTFMPEGYFHGGVHGGLGYFGSSSGGRMYGKIVKSP